MICMKKILLGLILIILIAGCAQQPITALSENDVYIGSVFWRFPMESINCSECSDCLSLWSVNMTCNKEVNCSIAMDGMSVLDWQRCSGQMYFSNDQYLRPVNRDYNITVVCQSNELSGYIQKSEILRKICWKTLNHRNVFFYHPWWWQSLIFLTLK